MAKVSSSLPNTINLQQGPGIPCKISDRGTLLNESGKVQSQFKAQQRDLNCNPQQLLYVIKVTKQFCHKYLGSSSDATVNHILRKISISGQLRLRLNDARELVAAVVYSQYSGIIRLKLKEFADRNQLNNKNFNKKYVAYQTLLKHQTCPALQNESTQQKLEQKPEEPQEKDQEKSLEEMYNQVETCPITTVKQAIELIYDGIFKSTYFQNNRRELIQKMSERCQEIDPKVYEEMTWTCKHSVKLYHAIFQHLKYFGTNISFTLFREAVSNFTGIHLKRTFLIATQRIFRKIEKIALTEGESVSSQNVEHVSFGTLL